MQIEMRGINKSFGGNPVLRDAGFELADGDKVDFNQNATTSPSPSGFATCSR